MRESKIYIFSIFASFTFILSNIVGMFLGNALGEIFYLGYQSYLVFEIPSFISIMVPTICAGVVSGILAGYINIKIYKDLRLFYSLIIPVITTIIMLIYIIYNSHLYTNQENGFFIFISIIIQICITIYIYFMILKKHVDQQQI